MTRYPCININISSKWQALGKNGNGKNSAPCSRNFPEINFLENVKWLIAFCCYYQNQATTFVDMFFYILQKITTWKGSFWHWDKSWFFNKQVSNDLYAFQMTGPPNDLVGPLNVLNWPQTLVFAKSLIGVRSFICLLRPPFPSTSKRFLYLTQQPQKHLKSVLI